ncbi:Protein kinase domain-containing protein [Mycena indigotica]|uniref:Protein kinase domain-containing protein n=1 Tax=Mycena indigotica TaxID=2126181 RepID=A0A8H6SKQ9_9AGAR|nr:Protein kinase domain-containing protein [Mycena indigotica]KAF7301144.1 Protein kinase domain-containing protein [Mycena indigotica]
MGDTYHLTLSPYEKWWIQYQPFLLTRGYQLRPRYQRDWVPSWTLPDSGFDPERENYHEFEDGIREMRKNVLDAVRLSDRNKVVLRRVITASPELSILEYLNTRQHPHNRTVPLLDVIPLPDDDSTLIIVIPFLQQFDVPVFRHLREVVECMRQYFQGLQFMHFHRITHRDVCALNMMMDATKVQPFGFHFRFSKTIDGNLEHPSGWRDRCLVAPVDYYFIDFGLSSFHEEGADQARDVAAVGQDKTVPELSDDEPYNPFKVDIYQLGNVFLKQSRRHPTLSPYFGSLLQSMTALDPAARPSAAQLLTAFEDLCSRIPENELDKKMPNIPQSPYYSGESDSDYELVTDSESESNCEPSKASDSGPRDFVLHNPKFGLYLRLVPHT